MIDLKSLKMMRVQYQRMYEQAKMGSDEELKYLGALELLESLIEDIEEYEKYYGGGYNA